MIVQTTCLCPETSTGTRHPEGDRITLRDKLDFRSAVTMQKAVVSLRAEVDDPTTAEILAALTEAYVVYGVEAWTLTDARGKAIPVNRQTITTYLLSDLVSAMDVADAADDIYQETVLLPLIRRGAESSETSPTTSSTSRATSSPPALPTPLKPSSTTTTRTGATAKTSRSRDGASSSSQNLASVG